MIYLVIGGSGSGKSEYAERLCCELANENQKKYYIATMKPVGAEAEKRIAGHRRQRAGKGFLTVEKALDIGGLCGKYDRSCVLLIECMSNLLANEMFEEEGALYGNEHISPIVDAVFELDRQVKDVVIVSNDVFSDGRTYDAETQKYIRLLGEINSLIARKAEKVIEVVCGIPLDIS